MTKKIWVYILSILFLMALVAWAAALSRPSHKLQIIACDVGQGDGILIQEGTTQVIVDGGPNNKIIECLSKYMPFWDREIELMVLTNPDSDHYTGLVEVLRRYKVENFLATEVDKETAAYTALKREVENEDTNLIMAREDLILRQGELSFEILSPSSQMFIGLAETEGSKVLGAYTGVTKVNDYSVVMLLSYGNFDALLTGDIEDNLSDIVSFRLPSKHIEYLKVPHHGSKNGLSQKLLDKLMPDVAVISDGKNNRYGHPHKEVLDMLSAKGIKTLRTDVSGDVIIVSDGKTWNEL